MGSGPLRMCLVVLVGFTLSSDEILAKKVFKGDQNIGTVLFDRSDCGKHCWTSEEFTVLNSRRMFQDILPKVKVIDAENDQYIALLMDYFHICLECVRKLSIGKTKHLMLKALADTMGGYLHVYVLPLTRRSYYAGNIKYRNAKRLFELFDELKNFLHTNGVGWLKPSLNKKHVKTPPIVITPPQSSVSCDGLITYPARADSSSGQGEVSRPNPSKRKRYIQRRRRTRGAGGSGPVTVPLPFLDDEVNPNSIALPFKTDTLQSLYCEQSAFSLVKYYVSSVKCIVSRSKTKFELLKFNKDMFDWLQQSVNPHLDDEKWYPAFGGVMRVISSLKETGLGDEGDKIKQGGDYQMMPKVKASTKSPEEEGAPPLYKGKISGNDDGNGVTFGTTELIVIALAGALLMWLLIGIILVCYRFLTRNSEECPPCESPANTPVAVLYENAEYCVPECPSKPSKRGLGRRLAEWWKKRFGPCEGGCDDEDEERCLAAISYSSKDTIDVTNSTSKSCTKKCYNSFKSPSQSVSPGGCVSSRSKTGYTSDSTSNSEVERAKSR
ncbi:uncharacterized protein LOC107226919 [Neodiprion lecontei]|uniref:Uncharacterized protein LOC107226919 n=1 Tax=Neodiprion lecontei TaxID=441921 RepID=A0ABM3FRI1_NEOLC|nr:uncharacterized protein LOC107226919 [Neodiprion lecontei]